MGFLRRLLGGGPESDDAGRGPDERDAPEGTFDPHADLHRVTVWLRLSDPDLLEPREQLRIFDLEDRLMRHLHDSGAGEHDSNDLERGFLALRLVGADADAIAVVVEPLLADARAGSYLAVRRGPAGTGEDRVELPVADRPTGAAPTATR